MAESITSESNASLETSTDTSDDEPDHSCPHHDRSSPPAWPWFVAGICWDFFLFACIFGTTLLGIYGECTTTGKLKTPSQFRHWKSPLQVCIGAVAATRRPVWWWMMKGKHEWAWMANLLSLDQAWTMLQSILLTWETDHREAAGKASQISPKHLTNPALSFGLVADPSPSSALLPDVQGQCPSTGPLPGSTQTSDPTQAAAEASFGGTSGAPEEALKPEDAPKSGSSASETLEDHPIASLSDVDFHILFPSPQPNDSRSGATPTPSGPLQANTSQTSTDSVGMRQREVRTPNPSLGDEGRGSAGSAIGLPDPEPPGDRDTANRDDGGWSVRDWRQILEERIVDKVCPMKGQPRENFRAKGYSKADCEMLEGLEYAWLADERRFPPKGYETLDGNSYEEIKRRRRERADARLAEKQLI